MYRFTHLLNSAVFCPVTVNNRPEKTEKEYLWRCIYVFCFFFRIPAVCDRRIAPYEIAKLSYFVLTCTNSNIKHSQMYVFMHVIAFVLHICHLMKCVIHLSVTNPSLLKQLQVLSNFTIFICIIQISNDLERCYMQRLFFTKFNLCFLYFSNVFLKWSDKDSGLAANGYFCTTKALCNGIYVIVRKSL